jgi:hypothetical protein
MLRTLWNKKGVLDDIKRFYEVQSRTGGKNEVVEHVIRLLLRTLISLYSSLVEFSGYGVKTRSFL